MKKFISLISLFTVLLISCQKGPVPINYGTDLCSLCRMKIMDNKFGSEVITKKGRAYKFDSDECLIGYLNTGIIKPGQINQLLVIDYLNPGNFIEAEKAFFLHSENVPSPMGGNITSFKSHEDADKINKQNGGTGVIVGWKEIQDIRNKQ